MLSFINDPFDKFNFKINLFFTLFLSFQKLKNYLIEKKIKVIHIIRSLIRTGAERISLDICNELNKREDVEVLFISMSLINEYEELTKKYTIQIYSIQKFFQKF